MARQSHNDEVPHEGDLINVTDGKNRIRSEYLVTSIVQGNNSKLVEAKNNNVVRDEYKYFEISEIELDVQREPDQGNPAVWNVQYQKEHNTHDDTQTTHVTIDGFNESAMTDEEANGLSHCVMDYIDDHTTLDADRVAILRDE